MILLTIRISGLRWKRLLTVPGYLDKEEVHVNIIYLDYMLFGRILIWRKPVFSEQVPLWSVIKYQCLGDWGWNSSKPWLIKMASQKQIIKTVKI